MIKNNLSLILGKKRIKMIDLSRKTGLNKNTILNLYHEKTSRIEFDVMDKLCKILNCQPGDILEYIPEHQELKEKFPLREYTEEQIQQFRETDKVNPEIILKVNQLINS